MTNAIIVYLPYLLSAITIMQLFLTGNKHRHSWLVGLGNQCLWLTWILVSANYGLLPMNAAIWVMYTRNHFKWRREAQS